MARKRSARPGTPEARESNPTPPVAVVERETEEEAIAETVAAQAAETTALEQEIIGDQKPRQTVTARCQEAQEQGACACRCRGRYHGKEHPEGWKDEEGCEPLSKEERKQAKKDTLNAWRRSHKDRMKTYMENWYATSDSPTAKQSRARRERTVAEKTSTSPSTPTPEIPAQ